MLSGNKTARFVGVDVGTRRVGIAISDPLGLFAQPSGAFSPIEALGAIERARDEHGIEAIVVGWPLEEDGSAGSATTVVEGFIKKLARRMRDVQIVKWDETYSSEVAKERLRDAGIRYGGRQKGAIDEAAAALLLQEFLDSRNENAQNRSQTEL